MIADVIADGLLRPREMMRKLNECDVVYVKKTKGIARGKKENEEAGKVLRDDGPSHTSEMGG